ncbi:MAG: OB-fold nucleic acid binding domain-containing protein, partial [Thaumarchaeota archaeon]|nr:OB-fold nucleic acid binding domain-containing protein [Nitrososphaerota archaeon]
MKTPEEELGDWRRTHYSSQIGPELDGKEVTVFGWVSSVRTHGGITFLSVSDRDGAMQVTVVKGKTSEEVVEKVATIGEHTSIGVRGVVKKIAKAPNGAEIAPTAVKILGTATAKPAFGIYGGELPSIEKRLDIRAVDLRRERAQALFRVQRV